MVIGLSIHTFTIAHVVISLVAIASGLIVLFGIWDVGGASLASLDRTMSGDHDSHQRYRIYVSDSQLYSRARRRRCFDVGVGSRADCSICEAFSRIVAADIRRHRRFSALFQCAGFDRSIVSKSANVEYACADASQTAFPDRAGRGTDGFPICRHCRGVQISPGTGHFDILTPERVSPASTTAS